jgi:hypothetical protein
MNRVAVVGTDHRGRLAVLAVGDYTGGWTTGRYVSNDKKIVCKVVGRGTPHVAVIFDSDGQIALTVPIEDPKKIERHDAVLEFPSGLTNIWANPDTLKAILEIAT